MAPTQVTLCLADPTLVMGRRAASQLSIGQGGQIPKSGKSGLDKRKHPTPSFLRAVTPHCYQREAGGVVTKETKELWYRWGKGMVGQGKGVTGGVVVFSQREDRIVNALLCVKLKLPARRQGTQIGAS